MNISKRFAFPSIPSLPTNPPQVSSHTHDYPLTTTQPREKDAFGLDTAGRMMLVPAERFLELVESLGEVYAVE
jgi:protein BCP1